MCEFPAEYFQQGSYIPGASFHIIMLLILAYFCRLSKSKNIFTSKLYVWPTPLLYIGLTEGAMHYTGGTRFMNLLPLVTKNQEKRPAFGHGLFC